MASSCSIVVLPLVPGFGFVFQSWCAVATAGWFPQQFPEPGIERIQEVALTAFPNTWINMEAFVKFQGWSNVSINWHSFHRPVWTDMRIQSNIALFWARSFKLFPPVLRGLAIGELMHVRVTGWGPGCHCASSLYLLKWAWCSSGTPAFPQVLWEVAAAGQRMVVLVMGQTLSMPDRTWPLPPPYVPVPGAGDCKGISFSRKGEQGCRGVWEMQKSLTNSRHIPGKSSRLDSGQQESRFSGHIFFSFCFSLLFFSLSFFPLFFFSWPWLSLYLKAAKAEKLKLKNVGELKQRILHTDAFCAAVCKRLRLSLKCKCVVFHWSELHFFPSKQACSMF